MEEAKLYSMQEVILERLQSINDAQLSQARLCGGTALSRCWLDHRVSYDLNFFLPCGFKAAQLSKTLKGAGISIEVMSMIDDSKQANQLYAYVEHEGFDVKISFAEDPYSDVFPSVQFHIGRAVVRTEGLPGLYHRLLRAVSSSVETEDEVLGAQKTATDLFDLYVLSRVSMPIGKFIETLPYVFALEDFQSSLIQTDWMKVGAELLNIKCSKTWTNGKDLQVLQNHLWQEIGADAIFEDAQFEYDTSSKARPNPAIASSAAPEVMRQRERRKKWWRFGR